jgi:hypothetical protein
MALEHRPDSIRAHEAMSMYSRNFSRVLEEHEALNRAALTELNLSWFGQFWRGLAGANSPEWRLGCSRGAYLSVRKRRLAGAFESRRAQSVPHG